MTSKGGSEQRGVCRSDLHPKAYMQESTRGENAECLGFMDLERVYDRINREALWQVLRMYDVAGKLLNGMKSMHVNSLALLE